jgi:enterochelin esterase-like enzyme
MEWTNKLGNLVLLSGQMNSKAQNYDFNKKKKLYFNGKSTSFRITHEVENKDKWTLEEIKARHQKLLNDAKEIFLDY